jgi:hypothetical protein
MKTIPINAAEAIIAPLFDYTLSGHAEFRLLEDGRQDGVWSQAWDACNIRSDAPRFTLVWQGECAFTGYDAMRFFITLAPDLRLSGSAVVDGTRHVLFTDVAGATAPQEPTSGPLCSPEAPAVLQEIRLDFAASLPRTSHVCLRWISLVNRANEPLIEQALPRYTPDWPGLLVAAPATTEVEDSLFAGAAELREIKARSREPRFRPLLAALQSAAAQWEGAAPEGWVREFIPCEEGLYRFVRVRDRGRPPFDDAMTTLAVAGFLCDRPDWSKLAARMVLAAAHMHWFEGPQSCFPGSSWHHGCYMEDHYGSAVAVTLPSVAGWLTPTGTARVLDALETAWAVVNEKAAEPGYRWYMNQGLVANRGRLLQAACLARYGRGERYRDAVEQSYRDHCTMLNHYLNAEGHCFEGPHYFMYSFNAAVSLWCAYAHVRNRPVRDIVPDLFKKTPGYVEAVFSSTSEHGCVIPLSITVGHPFSPLLLAFLAEVCDWEKGRGYLHRRLAAESAGAAPGREAAGLEGLPAFLMLALLATPPEPVATAAPGLGRCLRSGLLSYEFPAPARGKLWFCCERPSSGHTHNDRGSVILEANGVPLLLDPGHPNYANPMGTFMMEAAWHNLAFPEGEAMASRYPTSPPDLETPLPRVLDRAEATAQGVRFGADLKPLYVQAVRLARRDGVLVLRSATAGDLQLRDRWELTEPRRLRVTFQSYAPWTITGNSATATFAGTRIAITFTFGAGTPVELLHDPDRVDATMKPVFALIVRSAPTLTFDLITSIHFTHNPNPPS